MQLKITSDGTWRGTRVLNAETGEPIGGVRRIEIDPITTGGKLVTAHITVEMVELDITLARGQGVMQSEMFGAQEPTGRDHAQDQT
jgi:hypothetical protein